MIYRVRIIFLGILSLLVFQSMEENVVSAYMTDTCAENILSKHFNRHNLINSPKEYYIYTLEKIII